MLIVGYFLRASGMLLSSIITFFIFLLIGRVVISWLNADPSNPIVRFIVEATEPLLAPIRRRVPPLGMLDLSVFVLMLGLYFVQNFLVALMIHEGTLMVASAG